MVLTRIHMDAQRDIISRNQREGQILETVRSTSGTGMLLSSSLIDAVRSHRHGQTHLCVMLRQSLRSPTAISFHFFEPR